VVEVVEERVVEEKYWMVAEELVRTIEARWRGRGNLRAVIPSTHRPHGAPRTRDSPS
jgi:hypothetical protein